MKPNERRMYVGTYTTDSESEGIYRYRLDLDTGALQVEGLAAVSEDPSFLVFHPSQRFLYAANELMTFDGQPGGAVSAFAIDPQSGDLTFLNQQPTHGGAPCHMDVDRTGRWLLVANYMGGNAAVFPIQPTGHLGPTTSLVQHEGTGPDPERQESAHAHSITLDPANRFAFVADLGIDKLVAYGLDLETGALTANAETSLEAGAGPRHFTFHPKGTVAYLINELNSTITVFSYEAARGILTAFQTVPTLPATYAGENTCADIHITPDGRFLYGTNRGHDSIVIFALDASTGTLTYLGHASTQGHWPRNFAIDPTGTYLLVANKLSDSIISFRIDSDTGTLASTEYRAEIPHPVCLTFVA